MLPKHDYMYAQRAIISHMIYIGTTRDSNCLIFIIYVSQHAGSHSDLMFISTPLHLPIVKQNSTSMP